MVYWCFWNKILSWQAWAAMAPLKNIHIERHLQGFRTSLHPRDLFPAGKKSGSKKFVEIIPFCEIVLWRQIRKFRRFFINIFQPALICSVSWATVLNSCSGYSVNHQNLPFFSVFYLSIYSTGLVMIVWGLQEYISNTPYLCSCWKSPAWAVLTLISLSRFSK